MSPSARDAALLPGATAREWQLRGLYTSIGSVIAFVVLAVGSALLHAPAGVTIAIVILGVVAMVAGRFFSGIAIRKMQREAASGYCTMLDLDGYDLRDWRTGAVLRSRKQHPPAQGRWAASFGPSRAQLDAYRAARR